MKKEKHHVKIVSDEKDFSAVLDIITTHRSRALMSVNVESLLTYWEIGAFLSPRIHSGSWSTAVVGQLADYIKRNKPELRGYGKSNLSNMELIYDTYSGDAFLAILAKYSSHLKRYFNFFQSAVGKSSTGDGQGSGLSVNAIKVAAGNVSAASDIFQTTSGKSFHRHNPLLRREPHCGRVRHVACDEPGHGGAVQAAAYSQGSASADFRGVS